MQLRQKKRNKSYVDWKRRNQTILVFIWHYFLHKKIWKSQQNSCWNYLVTRGNVGKDVDKRNSFIAGESTKEYSYFRRVGQFLVNLTLFHHMSQKLHSLICIQMSKLRIIFTRNLPHGMFIAALFIHFETYKQPQYPSVCEWINIRW
jgi:hypothetical protein